MCCAADDRQSHPYQFPGTGLRLFLRHLPLPPQGTVLSFGPGLLAVSGGHRLDGLDRYDGGPLSGRLLLLLGGLLTVGLPLGATDRVRLLLDVTVDALLLQ